MATVCIVTRNTLVGDRRTFTEAQILARFGFKVVVIGFWAKGLPQEEEREGFKIKRIPPAAYRLASSWIKRYRRLSEVMPSFFRQPLRKADPFVSRVFRRIARAMNKPLTYAFLALEALQERADYYHAHFPLSLMVLTGLIGVLSRRPFVRDYNDIIVLNNGSQVTFYYEQETLWGKDLDERGVKRIEDIINTIPNGVRSILDVGCGDGRITNRLVDMYDRVVGMDISDTALQYVRAETVKASVDHMPFKDQSFDLVLAAELLEHLPASVYKQARREIQRVAREWILVSVPWRESLNLSRARCPRCGTVFHVNYHHRSFNQRKLKRLFRPEFKPVLIKYTGGERRSYKSIFLWTRQFLGGIWVRTPTTVCPKCSAHLYPGGFPERNAISKLCDKWNARIMARKKSEKSHVIVLYQGCRDGRTR